MCQLPKASRKAVGALGLGPVSSSPSPRAVCLLKGWLRSQTPSPMPSIPPTPHTYTPERTCSLAAPPMGFSQPRPCPLLLRHRSPSVSQLQGAQERSGTKAGRKRKQSSFPVSTPRPAQTLSTLAPETSLGLPSSWEWEVRHSRLSRWWETRQARVVEREVGWWLVPPPLDQRSEL